MKFIFKLSPFWESVGVIGGMIIGSGMFALPYAVSVSGFWGAIIGAALAFFAALSIHLVYGEVVVNTREKHRLPGYAKLYLGTLVGNLSKLASILGFNAVLLIYGALGGFFLSLIFGGEYDYLGSYFFGNRKSRTSYKRYKANRFY